MKTVWTTFSVALAVTVSLLTAEAQARGGHSGGSHISYGNHSHGTGSSGKAHTSTAHHAHQGNAHNSGKLGQGSKLDVAGGKNLAGKPNLDKDLGKDWNKNFAKFDYGKGLNKKWFPGKSWWGYGAFGWLGWGGWGGGWYDGYCGNLWPRCDYCQPWCASPYDNVCSEYYPQSEGVYDFASTPQGWELSSANDAPLADAGAAD